MLHPDVRYRLMVSLLDIAAQAHAFLTLVAGLAAGSVLVLAVVLWLIERASPDVPRGLHLAVDWLIVAIMATIALDGLLGVVLLLGTGGPRDWLHVVYGIAAFVALPLARILGGPASGSRRAVSLALGAFVTLGALVRLAGTG